MENRIFTRILKYREGEMTDPERAEFEQELESNEAMKEDMDTVHQLEAAIIARERYVLYRQVKDFADQQNRNMLPGEKARLPQRRRRGFLFGLAAAIALLIISVWLFSGSSSASARELYTAYYVPVKEQISVRSGTEDKEGGISLYLEGKYKAAIAVLESETVLQTRQVLCLADAYLQTGRPAFASRVLEKYIPLTTEMPDKAHMQWYLVLSYLADNQPGQAGGILVQLANSRTAYRHIAPELLEKIQ